VKIRAVTIAAGVVLLAGCSSVPDRAEAASGVALGMLTAVAAGNGESACATLAPETLHELEESAEQPCTEAILDEDLPQPGQVIGADVYGQWAQVRLAGDVVFLAVFPEGWRVVAAGCRSRGEQPYDCRLEGS
jgi:hypothetical protein